MRTYEKTHPWLKFELDASRLDYTTWLSLGEAVSKCEHIAGVPLSPDAAARLHSLYIARGALATTAIEGNTLTEEEVRRYLDNRLELPPSRQYLGQEIDNVIDACNRIGGAIIHDGKRELTVAEICAYNALVMKDLPLDEDVVPGILRSHGVTVGRYRGAPAEDCEYLLGKFCEWLNGLAFPPGLESAFSVLAAIAAHLLFVWIHPFADGNGRTARLIEFRFLLQAGFPTPAAHLLSNFYNQTRSEYYRQLDKASRSSEGMNGFIEYAVRGLVDQLREQLLTIREYQWDTTWENYVYQRLGGGGPVLARRRNLVLELAKVKENEGWVQIPDISSLSVKTARAYLDVTTKTLSRDLHELIEMGLVRRSERAVRANREIILAFLPRRAGQNSESSGY